MDGRCFIIGAGDFFGFVQRPSAGDYVIAADAGYKYCLREGVTPDLVVGDFDSLGSAPDFPNIVRMDFLLTIPIARGIFAVLINLIQFIRERRCRFDQLEFQGSPADIRTGQGQSQAPDRIRSPAGEL